MLATVREGRMPHVMEQSRQAKGLQAIVGLEDLIHHGKSGPETAVLFLFVSSLFESLEVLNVRNGVTKALLIGLELFPGTCREVHHTHRMFEAGMRRTRENIVEKRELADASQSLEKGVSHHRIFKFGDIDTSVQIVSDTPNYVETHNYSPY
jgi:hypothetical protein